MEHKSHIVNDGFLEKLDIEVAYADPERMKFIYPESLRKMEPPSYVAPFSAEDVYNSLVSASKIARKQLEEAQAKCPARVNVGPTSVWNTEATVEDHANDLKEFIEAVNTKD